MVRGGRFKLPTLMRHLRDVEKNLRKEEIVTLTEIVGREGVQNLLATSPLGTNTS